MKPNDDNGRRPTAERPFRVLVIAGSDRRQYNCPGVDSKARALMLRMADRLPPDWEIDYEDLGNVYGRARIQSCNACVSTSMALCVWPCNCYETGNTDEPDLMWDLDLYARLDLADAWAIIAPVNWYGPTCNLKLMFDRLVCMNGGNPREELIEHKDPEQAMALEHSPEWEELEPQPPRRPHRRLLLLLGRRRRRARPVRPAEELCAQGMVRSRRRAVRRRARRLSRRSSGSAATAASRCPTSFGRTRSPAKAWPTARTRPRTWSARTPSWRPSTHGATASPRSSHGRARSSPAVYRAYGYDGAGPPLGRPEAQMARAAPEGGCSAGGLLAAGAAGAWDQQRYRAWGDEERRRAAAGVRLPASQSFSSVMSGASGFFMPTTW